MSRLARGGSNPLSRTSERPAAPATFLAQREMLEAKWSELDDRVYRGEDAATLACDEAQRRLTEIERRREEKLKAFDPRTSA